MFRGSSALSSEIGGFAQMSMREFAGYLVPPSYLNSGIIQFYSAVGSNIF